MADKSTYPPPLLTREQRVVMRERRFAICVAIGICSTAVAFVLGYALGVWLG